VRSLRNQRREIDKKAFDDRRKRMSTKHSIWTQVLRISVGCLLTAGMAFGQGIEKGQVEATGQLGLVSGIGTHGSFGASIGSAVTDRVIALGEVSYIPLGS